MALERRFEARLVPEAVPIRVVARVAMVPSPRMDPLPYNLIVVRVGPDGEPFYEAKWRVGGRQSDGAGSDRRGSSRRTVAGSRRRGRVRSRASSTSASRTRSRVTRSPTVAAALAEAEAAARERSASVGITVRELAAEWLEWQRDVQADQAGDAARLRARSCASPASRTRAASAGRAGRILAALGDRPINRVTTREVSDFLRSLDRRGPDRPQRQQAPPDARDDLPLRVPGRHATRCRRIPSPDRQAPASRRRRRSTTSRSRRSRRSRAPPRPAPIAPRERDEHRRRCATMPRTPSSTACSSTPGCGWGRRSCCAGATSTSSAGRSSSAAGSPPRWRAARRAGRYRFVPLAHPAIAALEPPLSAGASSSQRDDYVFCNAFGRRTRRLGAPPPLQARLRGGRPPPGQAPRPPPRRGQHRRPHHRPCLRPRHARPREADDDRPLPRRQAPPRGARPPRRRLRTPRGRRCHGLAPSTES